MVDLWKTYRAEIEQIRKDKKNQRILENFSWLACKFHSRHPTAAADAD